MILVVDNTGGPQLVQFQLVRIANHTKQCELPIQCNFQRPHFHKKCILANFQIFEQEEFLTLIKIYIQLILALIKMIFWSKIRIFQSISIYIWYARHYNIFFTPIFSAVYIVYNAERLILQDFFFHRTFIRTIQKLQCLSCFVAVHTINVRFTLWFILQSSLYYKKLF